jgi:hypothetical protein
MEAEEQAASSAGEANEHEGQDPSTVGRDGAVLKALLEEAVS